MKVMFFLCIIFFFSYVVNCEEPWEYEDIENNNSQEIKTTLLIDFYQQHISSKSISRCPFYISCSKYAGIAIRKYGWFKGIILFIDRNFYRENFSAWFNYPLKERSNGVLKLDDSYYLFKNSFNPDFSLP
jgi:putative component of membrane protein insertase Oxa1/YidC/SpoIIIJ protein YidD